MSWQATKWVLDHSTSRLGVRLVLLAIADRVDPPPGCSCFCSVEDLGRRAAVSESQVHSAIRWAQRAQELRVHKGAGPKGTNVYVLPLVDAGIGGLGGRITISGPGRLVPADPVVLVLMRKLEPLVGLVDFAGVAGLWEECLQRCDGELSVEELILVATCHLERLARSRPVRSPMGALIRGLPDLFPIAREHARAGKLVTEGEIEARRQAAAEARRIDAEAELVRQKAFAAAYWAEKAVSDGD